MSYEKTHETSIADIERIRRANARPNFVAQHGPASSVHSSGRMVTRRLARLRRLARTLSRPRPVDALLSLWAGARRAPSGEHPRCATGQTRTFAARPASVVDARHRTATRRREARAPLPRPALPLPHAGCAPSRSVTRTHPPGLPFDRRAPRRPQQRPLVPRCHPRPRHPRCCRRARRQRAHRLWQVGRSPKGRQCRLPDRLSHSTVAGAGAGVSVTAHAGALC